MIIGEVGVRPMRWGRLELLEGRIVTDEPATPDRLSSMSWLGAHTGKPSGAGALADEQTVKRCRLDESRGGTRQSEKVRKAATLL